MYTIEELDTIMSGDIEVYSNGSFDVNSYYICQKDIKGKWCVFKDITDPSVGDLIRDRTTFSCTPATYQKVFISPSCKIPRDVIRRSYSITRQPDSIGCISVIPDKLNTVNRRFNIAVINKTEKKCILYTLIKKYTDIEDDDNDTSFEPDIVDKICDSLILRERRDDINAEVECIHSEKALKNHVSFLFKCEEYKDIINSKYPNRRYVLDTDIEYDPVPEICIDTLQMWMDMPKELLYKSVTSSNWKDYPLTLCAFFCAERQDLLWRIEPSFTYVYTNINLETYKGSRWHNGYKNYLKNNKITAKDWNMLQKWIMHRCGVSEEGGWCKNIPQEHYMVFMNKRQAVKPMYLDGSVSGDALADIIEDYS